MSHLFPCARPALFSTVPLLDAPGSSFLAVGPPQSSYVTVPVNALFGPHEPARGSLSSSRHHQARPPLARFPNPSLRSILRLSLPLDGLLRVLTLPAYFIRQPRSGFPVQGFLPPSSHPPSSGGASFLPFSFRRLSVIGPKTHHLLHPRPPRLQGFFPLGDSCDWLGV